MPVCINKEISPGRLLGHLFHEVFANPDQVLTITWLACQCGGKGREKGEFCGKGKQ